MIDLHCHILPGIDDGAQDMDESLSMSKKAIEDGIKYIVATPHHGGHGIQPKRREILESCKDLNAELKRNSLQLQVLPGSEVEVSPEVLADLEEGRLCTLGDKGRVLLLEFPAFSIPALWKDLFFQLRLKDIRPVLAHPERHPLIQDDPGIALEAVRLGALLQITGQSLEGGFGAKARETAHLLLKSRAVHLLASDAHSSRSRAPVLSPAYELAKEMLASDPDYYAFLRNTPKNLFLEKSINIPDYIPIENSADKKRFSFLRKLFLGL